MIDKNEIRENNKHIRRLMSANDVELKSKSASDAFLESLIYKNSETLMLYVPLGNEVDTRRIIERAFVDGKSVVFPVTNSETGEITPFFASKDTEFKKGAFSVSEPQGTESADPLEIDVVLVPGIAFDRFGTRVGFGKGCYDKLLKKTNAVKAGLCYEFQLTDEISPESHDVRMDFIITENGLIKCYQE